MVTPVQTMWIPTSSSEIDAAWLNAVLPDEVRDGGCVAGVSAENIGDGLGLLGEVARLTIRYDDGAGPRAVTSMIAKLPTSIEGMRRLGNSFGVYRKEHLFYEQVAPRVNISVPTAFVNLGDPERDAYVLLLEDMAPRRCGNQLASCSWSDAVVAIGELARFHASWWEHPELESFAGDWQMARRVYVAALPELRRSFASLVGDQVLALAERSVDRWDDAVAAGAMRGPHTLIHGDFRLDNMMFRDHEGGTEFTLLDWQLMFRASPMWDVVHFLAGNFEPAWRRRHQSELVRIYHDALVGNGVTDYSFEQCWQGYRANGLVLLAYLVNLAGHIDLETLDGRGRALCELVFRRYATAVDDLGSASFLV
jgi:hypothetical protein